MANPTTNYGFIMPTPTDLVTDLPADFGVFGQAVDTQMLTNANAAIAKTIVDAKGDLIAATAADTPARLAVGTNGQVLQADSTAATGLVWATPAGGGGMTSIATGSLSGATTTISSISGSYKNLQLVLNDFYPSTGTALQFKFNSITDYSTLKLANQTNDGGLDTYGEKASTIIHSGLNNVKATDNNNACIVNFYDYANTSSNKVGEMISSYYSDNTFYQTNFQVFTAKSSGAITSIDIKVGAGTWSGGTYTLYGVN
jgi:hypothetical protein